MEALNLNHTHIYQRGYRENERIANAIIDEYPGRGSELSLEFLDFSHSASPYLAIFCHIRLCMSFLNRCLFYFCSIMKEHVLEWFKTIIRRRVDLRRLTAICGGNRILARRVAVRGLKELAEDIEKDKD